MSQRNVFEILRADHWSPMPAIKFRGVARETWFSYRMLDGEPFAVLEFTQGIKEQGPDRILVEVAKINDQNLDRNLVNIILHVHRDTPAIPVLADDLKEEIPKQGIAHLMCHPNVELPEGLSAIRHELFPKPQDNEHAILFACQKDAGIMPITSEGQRGALILPERFFKIALESPIPIAFQRLLTEDPFEG